MSVFVKPLMDWFMFGMVIETGPKFYMVPFPTQKVTDSEFLYKSFVINVLHFPFFFFAKPSMDFIQLWRDDRALSKILCSSIPIPVHDLKIKVTDFEFFCVKSSQYQLLQNLWLIWIVFGMNGYKILKCFRKEKRVSGELPCLATGLIKNGPRAQLREKWEKFPHFQFSYNALYILISPSAQNREIWAR